MDFIFAEINIILIKYITFYLLAKLISTFIYIINLKTPGINKGKLKILRQKL